MSNNKAPKKLSLDELSAKVDLLCRSIHSADPSGDDLVIKDLSRQSKSIMKDVEHIKNNTITKYDINHLEWIYGRMVNQLEVDGNYDYMIRFREIIEKLKN